jgi:peptidoglycan/LPS O-acetylase OafA/YrhL
LIERLLSFAEPVRMKTRTLLHLVALVALVGFGVWIAYQGISAPIRLGPLDVDLDSAVMYWFALLVYLFIGLVLYYPLRTRSWRALLIGHVTAVTIALASTATVIMLGYQHAQPQAPAAGTSLGTRVRATGNPSAQRLPLPPPDTKNRLEDLRMRLGDGG